MARHQADRGDGVTAQRTKRPRLMIPGGLWDDPDIEVRLNHTFSNYGPQPCRHCVEKGGNYWFCPVVIVASNEGGFNSTGVCLDCIIEHLPMILAARDKTGKVATDA